MGFKDEKIEALEKAFTDRDPFSTGTCLVPEHQLLLYDAHGENLRRIDFATAKTDDLVALYQACTPAPFGRNKETVFDERYRKAGKMDLDAFATQFDPRSLGIHEKIAKGFMCTCNVEMELYKLNVYGEGDFFKSHKDTPRGKAMIGSLVVVLPTRHEGGQLVLRQDGREWTIDFSDNFAAASNPSICYAAFFGDVDHEVLPVTSGHRVTLTYNLYYSPSNASAASIPTPFHEKLKRTLIEVLNDGSKLPKGGYLGFGLVHKYVYDDKAAVDSLLEQLKGSDRALADICDELALPFSIKLLYRDKGFRLEDRYVDLNFLADRRLKADGGCDEDYDYLEDAFCSRDPKLSINEVEGVNIIGGEQVDREEFPEGSYLKPFYRVPVTQVLEISKMSSVQADMKVICYGNSGWAFSNYIYGTACMLVEVKPVELREPLVL